MDNRFSAAKARRECAAKKARRTRSTSTKEIVRKQCATVRISGKSGMNAQDDTLQNATESRFRGGRTFCGAQARSGSVIADSGKITRYPEVIPLLSRQSTLGH